MASLAHCKDIYPILPDTSAPLLYESFRNYRGHRPADIFTLVPYSLLGFPSQYHMVLSSDGEWSGKMNERNKPLVIGYKLQDGEPCVLEHPECDLKLRQTWKTISLPAHLLGMKERVKDDTDNEKSDEKRPSIVLHAFIYFAAPDFTMLFNGGLTGQMSLCKLLQQNRRVRMANKYQHPEDTGIILTDVNGVDWDLFVKIHDVCALTGAFSYKEACEVAQVSGYDREVKSFLDMYKGGREREAYLNHTEQFCRYNENDLYNQEIMWGMQNLWRQICLDTNVRDISDELGLTHGANVVKYCVNKLSQLTGIDDLEKKYNAWFLEKYPLGTAKDIREPFYYLATYNIKDEELYLKNDDREPHVIGDFTNMLKYLNREASSLWLATQKEDTRYLLAAIDGGRCKNELPRRTSIKGTVLDNDIDGCYGNGLLNQTYPLGRPSILRFAHSNKQYRPTLGQFISNVRVKESGLKTGFYNELVPGLWMARISTIKPLSFDIDLIASKMDLKPQTEKEVIAGREFTDDDRDENTAEIGGRFVHLLREIETGVLTHDILQVLLEVATNEERGEVLKNIVIDAVIYYAKSDEVSTFVEVLESVSQEKGMWTSPDIRIGIVDDRSHKWCSVPMGQEWVDLLLGIRKSYPKKTAYNTFYKLIVNCIYGVACSVFFPEFSNVVVANNITGRARALSWLMAKSMKGQQSITDGSMCDLNNVMYWLRKKPGFHVLCNLDDVSRLGSETRKNFIPAPISRDNQHEKYQAVPRYHIVGGYYQLKEPVEGLPAKVGYETRVNQDWAALDDIDKTYYKLVTTIQQGEDIFDVSSGDTGTFDQATWAHMTHFFRGCNIDILQKEGVKVGWEKVNNSVTKTPRKGLFSFEGKDVYIGASFHSQSNYYAEQVNGSSVLKVRGTKLKAVPFLNPEGIPETVPLTFKDHSVYDLMKRILNYQPVPAYPRLFVSIPLKVSDWRAKRESVGNPIREMFLQPGDSTSRSNWLRAISPSMFRYLNKKQYDAFCKKSDTYKEHLGYGLESDYLDEHGLLNYSEAVREIQDSIDKGKVPPKVSRESLTGKSQHPYWEQATASTHWLYDDRKDEVNDIDW